MDWKEWKPDKEMTLCYLFRGKGNERQILLGMKKRGFGKGLWNGLGGKIEPGEDLFESVRREIREESGLEVGEVEKVGELMFEIDGEKLLVHVFISEDFDGEGEDTEEMELEWFKVSEIPYDRMWEDDREWMPVMLEGMPFRFFARFSGRKMEERCFLEL